MTLGVGMHVGVSVEKIPRDGVVRFSFSREDASRLEIHFFLFEMCVVSLFFLLNSHQFPQALMIVNISLSCDAYEAQLAQLQTLHKE